MMCYIHITYVGEYNQHPMCPAQQREGGKSKINFASMNINRKQKNTQV